MCESSNNYSINTGNGYYGAYQFNLATWQGVGGTGYPNQASPAEQDARALKLYRLRGWQPWTCATILGLKEDADARSGRVNDIQFPSAGTPVVTPTPTPAVTPTPTPAVAPAWPGPQYFALGDHSNTIAKFQAQLHARGSYLVGDGNFGPNTQTEVKRIQAQNGLPQTGILGPVTWKLAWTGTYHPGSAPAVVTPVATTPVATPAAAGSAPAWTAPQYYSIGDHSDTIAQFQAQLHARGSFLVGDGNFGRNTQAAVNHLQALNGLPQTGILGPVTWKLAWTGTWSNVAPV
jgi:peptidoglycan hydrolase-like protein with peptidoglycan-binding domain